MQTLLAALALVSLSSVALAEDRPDPHHLYRLDFALVESEPGKPATTTHYALSLEERRAGEIRLGSNVALAAPGKAPVQRADLGLVLRSVYTLVGEDLVVDSEIEISNARDAQTFGKLVAKGNALVAAGRPALIASIEDPVTHHRYEVTVAAIKLR